MSPPDSRRLFASLCLLCGAALAIGAAPAAPAGASLPPSDVVWHALDTPGFTVVGDARPEELRVVARDLESLRHVLARIGGGAPGDVRPIPVVVFASAKSFDPYRRGFGAGAKNIAGFFTERDGRRMIALTTGFGESGYATVYHEYLHHVVQTKLGKVPVWFNEGIAGMYETFECDGKSAVVGKPPREKLRWLNAQAWHPLTELFRVVDATRLHDQSEDITEAFYVESWLLVHDLFFGHPDRRQQLATFLEAFARGEPHDQAFERSFVGGIAGVEDEVRTYLHGTLPFVKIRFEDLKIEDPGEARVLDRAAVLDTLGELVLASSAGPIAVAEAHFKGALEAKPGDLRAQAGLGEAAFLNDRADEAGPMLDAAVDAGFDDPLALGIAARLTFVRGHGDAAAALRTRKLLERAVRIEPDDPELLALLGVTFVNDPGDVAEGVAALEKADRLRPDRPDYLLNLIMLHVHRRDRASAETLAARISAVGNAEDKVEALEALVPFDLMDSDDAVKAHDYARAIALLKSARDHTALEVMKAKITDRIGFLEAAAAAAKKPPPRAATPNR